MSSHGVPRTARDRTAEQLKKDLERIEKYRALESQFRQKVSEKRFDSATFDLTTKLLRINPEYYSVWNGRRRCLLSGPLANTSNQSLSWRVLKYTETINICEAYIDLQTTVGENETQQSPPSATAQNMTNEDGNAVDMTELSDVIRTELLFTVPLLVAHPKCYWIWNYRMWTLEQATLMLPVTVAKTIWQKELGLVSEMLRRDRRNYHAWAYRRYVVSQLESDRLDGQSMAEPEFSYTTQMIENDLSNFSAWHNRAQLIPKLLSQRKADSDARRVFLDQEFAVVDNGLNVGPEDQSLWYYHQYLTLNVVEQPGQMAIAPEMTVEDRIKLITREIEFIKDLLGDYPDVKWIFEMLLEYTLLINGLRDQSLSSDEMTELESWVAEIKKLDPQRSNRWKNLADLLVASDYQNSLH